MFCFNCPRLDLASALPSSGFKGARASDAAFPRAQDGSIYRESPPSSPSSSPAPSSLVDWEKTAHTAPKTATRTQPRMGSLIPNGSLVPSPFSLLSTRAKAGEAVRVAAPTMAAASIFGSKPGCGANRGAHGSNTSIRGCGRDERTLPRKERTFDLPAARKGWRSCPRSPCTVAHTRMRKKIPRGRSPRASAPRDLERCTAARKAVRAAGAVRGFPCF